MTTARGTIGYIAPEVFSRNFGNVSYKSDIYSFGMLLFEMNTNQVYFPEWIYNRLHRGEELGIQLMDDADAKITKKLAIVGLWYGDTLIMPANPFSSTNPTVSSGVVDVRPFHQSRNLSSVIDQ
ncbi:hypothetical protein CsSME_00035819 [Camellia sinensis var. sinensis]